MGFRLHLFIISIFFVSLAILSCSKQKSKHSDIVIDSEMPKDESTPEERVEIDKIIKQISAQAAIGGKIVTFDLIPIFVTTEDMETNKRQGYCQRDENGKGQYIVINRKVFERDKEKQTNKPLFSTILHEIGHCYYAREHERDTLVFPGCNFMLEADEPNYYSYWNYIPKSVMFVDSQDGHEFSPAVVEHKALQEYFISEILSDLSFNTIENLNTFSIKSACISK